jgi:osmoprotectant transport system ATP-binding protein
VVIRSDADLRTAVALMFTHDMTWLACVDADGCFIGRVTQASITHRLGDTYRVQPAIESAAIPKGAVA